MEKGTKSGRRRRIDPLERNAIKAQWEHQEEAESGDGIAYRATTPLSIARQCVSAFRGGKDNYDGGQFRIVRTTEGRDQVLFVDRETGIWRESQSTASIYIQAVVEGLRRRAVDAWEPSELKSLSRRLPTVEGPAFERSVIEMLPTAARRKGLAIVEWADFNRDRYRIGTPKGVVDLRTMKVLAPIFGKDYLITRRTSVSLDLKAEHPAVDALTAHLPEAVRGFLWEAVGYAMLGRANRRFYLLLGETNCGKTLLADSLRLVLGDYCATIPRGSMAMPRRAVDATSSAGLAEAGKAFLDGRRLAIEDEPNPGTFDAARLKQITGGGPLEWKPLHGHWRRGLLTATPLFFSNDLASIPKLGLSDEALVSRLAAIPFPKVPAAQRAAWPSMETVKGDPGFHAAMFARIVRAAADAALRCDDDRDAPPALIPEIAAQIRGARQRESGDLGLLADRIIEDDSAFLDFSVVWQAWAELCDHDMGRAGTAKIGDITRRAFRRAIERWSPGLARASYERRRRPGGGGPSAGWVGFRLLPPPQAEVAAAATGATPAAQPLHSAPDDAGRGAGERCATDGCERPAIDWVWAGAGVKGRRWFCSAHAPPDF